MTNNDPRIWFDIYILYGDQSTSEISSMRCSEQCIDGYFNGFIDVVQDKSDPEATLVFKGSATKNDVVALDKFSLGDFRLKTNV